MNLKFSSALITCEHAGNDVPDEFQFLFKDAIDILESHRGWDPGAIEIARYLGSTQGINVFCTNVTRLLIEANRSIDHPDLFSDYSRMLVNEEKEKIKKEYYFPYRNKVEEYIESLPKPVLHLSIHTFTPELNSVVRKTDIGLLFDPSRKLESMCCDRLHTKLNCLVPYYQIDFNEPYAGTDDGFTTYLRRKFAVENYAGIEIEINQKYFLTDRNKEISYALNKAVSEILD